MQEKYSELNSITLSESLLMGFLLTVNSVGLVHVTPHSVQLVFMHNASYLPDAAQKHITRTFNCVLQA